MIKRPLLGTALALLSFFANAAIPIEYTPVVVKAPFSISEFVYDLTPAITKARAEGKPLFIYRAAQNDCPPCVVFERFLEDNKAELVPAFQSVVVVDIRGWLREPTSLYIVDGQRLTFGDFNRRVGDRRARMWFPYVWFVTPDLRQIQQLGDGSGNSPSDVLFTVEKLKALLATHVKK